MSSHTPLAVARKRLLQLTPRKRVDEILASDQPAQLVRALPAQEFFLTIAEVGVDTTLPLLKHATRHQLDFLIDIDTWDGDHLDPEAISRWVEAIGTAGDEVIARWLRTGDEATVVLALSKLLRVYKLDESSDPDYWPPEEKQLATLDGTYYVEPRSEDIPQEALSELWKGLALVRSADRNAYQALLEQVMWLIPAEHEETTYERRVSRLAEYGFPAFEEAIEVWQAAPAASPPRSAGTGSEELRQDGPASDTDRGSSIVRHQGPALLTQALQGADPQVSQTALQALARLANRFAVASLLPLGDPQTHRTGMLTAASHTNLGLEILAQQTAKQATTLLAEHPLREIADTGTAAVQQRAHRARSLADGWLARPPRARKRIDPDLSPIFEGLTESRPVWSDESETRPYREIADLDQADRALATLEAIGQLVESINERAGGLHPQVLDPDIEWTTLALTAVAQHVLGNQELPEALSPDRARDALNALLDPPPDRRVTPRFVESVRALGLAGAQATLRERLETEFAELTPDSPPDPRFVQALLIRANQD